MGKCRRQGAYLDSNTTLTSLRRYFGDISATFSTKAPGSWIMSAILLSLDHEIFVLSHGASGLDRYVHIDVKYFTIAATCFDSDFFV